MIRPFFLMHRTLILLLGSGLALSSAPIARAASLSSLTWDEARTLAAQANPALTAGREALEQARYDYQAARASYWPTVSGSAGYSRSDTDGSEGGASDQTSMGLSAQYSLFSGFSDQARVHQSEAALRGVEANWSSTQADVSASLRRSFVQLLYAQQRVAMSESIVSRRQQNLDLVQLRFDSGSENEGSLLRAKATTGQAEAELEQARRSVHVQQRGLSSVLGQDARDEWVVKGDWQHEDPDPDPLWDDLAKAMPSVRAAQAALESSRAALTIARGTIYPDLALRAGIDRSGDEWPPTSDGWSVGTTLSVPLFSGGKNINQLNSASAALRQAEAQLREAKQAALLSLETAWTNLRDARQQRDVRDQFLRAAQVRAEISREQYATGLLSFQNWDQIEDELIQSQQSLLASDRDAALAAAEWDRTRGISILSIP